MEEIRRSDKNILYKKRTQIGTIYYRASLENEEDEPVEIFKIEGNVITYHYEGESIKTIVLLGFEELPNMLIIYGFGFTEKSINNFIRYTLAKIEYDTIVITDGVLPNENVERTLYFDIDDILSLESSIRQEQRACNDTKRTLVRNFIFENYPDLPFSYRETNNNKSQILRNLNAKLIEQLTADEIEEFGRFYVEASKKYSRADIVQRMVKGLQKNAQVLTLQQIIGKYETLLEQNPSESIWQSFFNDYITLFDNRYYKKIDDKNISIGVTKYPDLVLVDIYGYIDFYELKKSDMSLLRYDTSHSTFYWSPDVAKVIAQVTNYLQLIKKNSDAYINAIREQTKTENTTGIEVNIISPRAIIVAGSSSELNTPQKKNSFKNLRESLKDVEFVLYDELLDRLKNLLEQIKI